MDDILKEANQVMIEVEAKDLKQEALASYKMALAVGGLTMDFVAKDKRTDAFELYAETLSSIFKGKGLITEGDKAIYAILLTATAMSLQSSTMEEMEAAWDKVFEESVWGKVVRLAS